MQREWEKGVGRGEQEEGSGKKGVGRGEWEKGSVKRGVGRGKRRVRRVEWEKFGRRQNFLLLLFDQS